MEEQREALIEGKARVTASGIWFNGARYACRRALREQWFEKAFRTGEWDLNIAYVSKPAEAPGSIYISGKTENPDNIGFPVPELRHCDDVERYHILFRQLVRELKKLRS